MEARLGAEREVLYAQKNSSNQILANLQQIQLNLERREDEAKTKLEATNDQLTQEIDLLRKRVDEEQEHFKASVKNWESANKELQERSERAEASERTGIEKMTLLSNTNETLKEEVKELKVELEVAESRLAGRGQLSTQASMVEGDAKSRYRDVEILLGKSKQENKQLNSQLAAERKKVMTRTIT